MLFDPEEPRRVVEVHNQMVASAKSVLAAHEIDPNIKVGAMVAAGKVDFLAFSYGSLDLVAFTTGQMKKRYGMIYVDRNDDGTGDLHRVKKDSFAWYAKVIASDGRDLD